MDYNTELQSGETLQNVPQKNPQKIPVLWFVATLVLCAVFIFVSVPRASAQGEEQDSKKYTSIIQSVFDFIQKRYVEEVDPKVLYEGTMTGMFNALGDPYTAFLPESAMSDLNDTTQGNFGGVGLYISKPTGARPDGKPAYVEVASPIEDTPGARAGISPGDLIVEINDESTDALTMDEVLSRLRGAPGVDVRLLIRRGEKLVFPVTLTRAIIEVPTVKHAMIEKIGYLKLLTFTPMSVDRTREALEDFKNQGYTSFILDLRNNYGGLLHSAVGISDLFLEGGVVVSTKSRISSENAVFTARRGAVVPSNIPIVVLINRGSASASEIVAGALKDRGRAYLVGEKSYGKGSVQQVFPLEKAGFRITTARYYTPSDVNIDKIGIPPDREVLFPEFTNDEAEKLSALITDNKIPAFVEANPDASPARVDTFAKELNTEYMIDLTLLRRLIWNEQTRTAIAPVYDLEYDVQLQEAVNILQNGNFGQLMQTTKTLRELQNEATVEETALAS
ncbi:carboxyl- protease [Treponema primitia ZAS-2]|uniref:Carboxyl-protease n=1 Tax=Treponema primitia (strain ATCC BAA-887 / DSM 12427 / ZAS-2) TaxID=545694 RepID=F5YND0_TREPZ|nr:S41 family peptidase [Treponema primitia]AEF84182.1 carboxyl- protease [Treponema primitia ZAS-2]